MFLQACLSVRNNSTGSLPLDGRPDSKRILKAGSPLDQSATPGIAFFLFILVNAVLFVRPAEIVPELLGLPIYEYVILACLAASVPGVLHQLKPSSLYQQPITVCVLGLMPAISLSHLAHLDLYSARWSAIEFSKIVVYYMLLVANVCSVSRFKQFLAWLVVLIGVLAALALLQYFEVIEISALSAFQQREDNASGEVAFLSRLQSTGIYNDPNDLCLILLTGMGICLFWITGRQMGWIRVLSAIPFGIFGFALYFTYSRAGFLALLVGLGCLFWTRYGWRKTILFSALVLPVAFWLFAGRQTELDVYDRENTAQSRIHLWSAGLQLFRQAPIFGIGKDGFQEEESLVAHNSFLHCFVELGLFGGTLFLGMFVCSIWMLQRVALFPWSIACPGLSRFRSYLLAIVFAYFFGLLSLSRAYVVTPYLILGLVTAFVQQFRAYTLQPVLSFNMKVIARLGMASVIYLGAIYAVVRIFARWGLN